MSNSDFGGDTDVTLQHKISQLTAQIEALKDPSLIGGERENATNQCLTGIARISNEVKDAAAQLPPYEQRVYSNAVKSLAEKFQEAKSTTIPKRKFAFKNKPQESRLGVCSPVQSGTPQDRNDAAIEDVQRRSEPSSEQPPNGAFGTINITGSRSERVVLPSLLSADESPRASASITNVQDCMIDLRNRSSDENSLAKLHISEARQSLIIGGHVGGSVFLSESQNCVLLVTSGQMRLYKCHNCVIYLHCTSKPVIELSDNIKFAPLPEISMNCISQQHKSNTWDQVEDFNWLGAEPSPHWTTIDIKERIPDELWQSVLHDPSEGHILHKILSASI